MEGKEGQMSEKRSLQNSEAVEKLARAKDVMLREIHKVIIGQDEIIEQILITMFCKGHCLVVGVPGLAKTLLVQTIAKVLRLKFSRIQFTPDLMPSDITGTTLIEEEVSTGRRDFRFVRGPIFGNIILADEINRTPPKTQAALLQAMQEYEVTAGGETYGLDLPFFVLATQNPIEQEGTYPLPEAQLDRFMLNLYIDYPTLAEERAIVKATTYGEAGEVRPVLTGKDIVLVQDIVRRVPVSEHVMDYAIKIVRATRPGDDAAPGFVRQYVSWGAGPRAAQNLVLGAKARAIISGRYSVTCEDIRALAHPVMRHRIFTNFNADAEGISSDDIVELLLKEVHEPTAAEYA